MTRKEIKAMSDTEIRNFILKRLSFRYSIKSLKYVDHYDNYQHNDHFYNDHERFEMSGYENKTGTCTVRNQNILNRFADIGIYDYTEYLFLDFYKGTGTLYYKYFHTDKPLQKSFGGWGTTQIIFEILSLTVNSSRDKRRRS